MRPTFTLLLVLSAVVECLLVTVLHWSLAYSLLIVGVTLGALGLGLLGFAWMFVPAAQRPDMLGLFWSVCRQNVLDLGRALSFR